MPGALRLCMGIVCMLHTHRAWRLSQYAKHCMCCSGRACSSHSWSISPSCCTLWELAWHGMAPQAVDQALTHVHQHASLHWRLAASAPAARAGGPSSSRAAHCGNSRGLWCLPRCLQGSGCALGGCHACPCLCTQILSQQPEELWAQQGCDSASFPAHSCRAACRADVLWEAVTHVPACAHSLAVSRQHSFGLSKTVICIRPCWAQLPCSQPGWCVVP